MTKRRIPAERQIRPTSCVACGGAATGYNYDAPSCHSCKTFFRRMVLKQKVFLTCLKSGKCNSEESIRQCRTCRFEKCVAGGMNPRLITNLISPGSNPVLQKFYGKQADNEDEPSTSNPPSAHSSPPDILDTTTKRSRNESCDDQLPLVSRSASEPLLDSAVPSDPDVHSRRMKRPEAQLLLNPPQLECKLERMMQNIVAIDAAHHKLRTSAYSPIVLPTATIDDYVHGPSKLGETFAPWFPETYDPISIQLVPEEVFIKHRITIDFDAFDYTKKKLWYSQDLVYSIEYMKALPIYHLLENSSKKVLLCSVITCNNFNTAYYSYTQNSDKTCYPDGGVMSWSKELEEQAPDSTRFHTAIIGSMRESNLDKREYALLKMILVCNSMLDGLTPHDVKLLQHEKELCTKTLVSYVLASRGVKEGPAHIAKLMSVIDVVNKFTAMRKSLHILILAMGLHKYRCAFAESIFHSS